MRTPLVSIIVPCYNQAQYLEEALQSVLNQTYTNWECVIVNDGSPDNTEEVVKKWIEKDNRFHYIFSENRGVSCARNLGISMSKGELILPLDADDKISNSYLTSSVSEFFYNPNLKLVYCKAEKFGDENGPWILKSFSLRSLAFDNMIFCSALFRKLDWERTGGYDPNMLKGLEDWEFWISLLKNGGKVKCIDEVGFFYRVKESSRQSDLKNESKKELFTYLSIKHADFFVTQIGSFMSINDQMNERKKESYKNLKSKKIAIDVLFKAFFGFSIFKNK